MAPTPYASPLDAVRPTSSFHADILHYFRREQLLSIHCVNNYTPNVPADPQRTLVDQYTIMASRWEPLDNRVPPSTGMVFKVQNAFLHPYIQKLPQRSRKALFVDTCRSFGHATRTLWEVFRQQVTA